MTVLGNGVNEMAVATRDGRTVLLDLPAKSLKWGRSLAAVSGAEVTVAPAKCTRRMGDVHPWSHSLVGFRNGERVWEGPIRRRVDSSGGLTFTASDVLGWMDKRPVRAARLVTASPVLTELSNAVTQAFATDDPYVTPHVLTVGAGGPNVDVQVGAGEKMWAEVLAGLTAGGGRFTAVGRRIVLWDSQTSIGTLPDLSPEDHLTADVDVIEDGDLLATEVWARNDDGVLGTAVGGGGMVDPFYGHVGIITPSTGITPTQVTGAASRAIAQAYPAPSTISVPDGATLRCDAPFPIDRLIPGVTVPVVVSTATAREVRGTFILSSVQVTQTADAAEQVQITLTTGVDS